MLLENSEYDEMIEQFEGEIDEKKCFKVLPEYSEISKLEIITILQEKIIEYIQNREDKIINVNEIWTFLFELNFLEFRNPVNIFLEAFYTIPKSNTKKIYLVHKYYTVYILYTNKEIWQFTELYKLSETDKQPDNLQKITTKTLIKFHIECDVIHEIDEDLMYGAIHLGDSTLIREVLDMYNFNKSNLNSFLAYTMKLHSQAPPIDIILLFVKYKHKIDKHMLKYKVVYLEEELNQYKIKYNNIMSQLKYQSKTLFQKIISLFSNY